MTEQEIPIGQDWRSDITPARNTLKIRDGEIVRGVFQDEGKLKVSKDYGTSVAFSIKVDGEDEVRTFYVKSNNFSLLGQLKELGKLTNLRVEIKRVGSKKSDTRYSISKL